MSTLILTNRRPSSRLSGYDLRVYSLSASLEGPLHLIVVPLNVVPGTQDSFDVQSVFDTIDEVAVPPGERPLARRHLRLSDADFLRWSQPELFKVCVGRIRNAIRAYGITRLIVFGTNLAGLAREVAFRPAVIDVCDSVSLTQRREYELARTSASATTRMWRRAAMLRSQRCEAMLPRWFDRVTTINDADSKEIARLSSSTGSAIHTIPNGVDADFLAPLQPLQSPIKRAVSFWGNLAFSPNREAMRYFFREIYSPHLRDRGVSVRVIGRSPEPWLQELAACDSGVEVLGYVGDLKSALAGIPVLVNPMVIGSGLKNKVLEAFGLGIVVVSTSLGMESFPDAVKGTHFLGADDAGSFAEAILKLLDDEALLSRVRDEARTIVEKTYKWSAVGEQWRTVCAVS